MLAESLLPSSPGFELGEVTVDTDLISLTAHSIWPMAICPICHEPSSRVHSHYWRRAADLSCAERQLQIHIWVRRFFCDNDLCKRKTFAEQFPDVVVRHARRTNRLVAILQEIGLKIGGEPAAQVLTRMAMPASGDTVLRFVRLASESASGSFGMNEAISAIGLGVDGSGVAYKHPIPLKYVGAVDRVGDERTVCRPIQKGSVPDSSPSPHLPARR
jgi:hypothetical protein